VNRREILAALPDERDQLVADLRTIAPADWEHPSLCDGWAVRDVVGHLLRVWTTWQYGLPVIAGLVRYGFRPNVWIQRDARRRAARRSPESLIADLAASRSETTFGARFHPMRGISLAEWVVHGQDIRRPLGIPPAFSTERLIAVADTLTGHLPYPLGRARRSPTRYEATDAAWSWGTGEVVRAPLEEIVMRLAGRPVDAPPV
jgi:uncharacterized protein (TIGR03083 family)